MEIEDQGDGRTEIVGRIRRGRRCRRLLREIGFRSNSIRVTGI